MYGPTGVQMYSIGPKIEIDKLILFQTLLKILKFFLYTLDLEAKQVKIEAMLANHETRMATSERDVTECDENASSG